MCQAQNSGVGLIPSACIRYLIIWRDEHWTIVQLCSRDLPTLARVFEKFLSVNFQLLASCESGPHWKGGTLAFLLPLGDRNYGFLVWISLLQVRSKFLVDINWCQKWREAPVFSSWSSETPTTNPHSRRHLSFPPDPLRPQSWLSGLDFGSDAGQSYILSW